MKAFQLVPLFVALFILAGCRGGESKGDYIANKPPGLTPVEVAQLTERAEGGDPKAARELYHFHDIITGDDEAATKWVKMGAEGGDAPSQYCYAMKLLQSRRAEDRKQALTWLKRAGDQGEVLAMSVLAREYESGENVPINLSAAKTWHELGALAGNRTAMITVAEYLYKGKGGARDPVSGYAWARLAEIRLPLGSISHNSARKLREAIQNALTPEEQKAGEEKFDSLQGKVPAVAPL